MRRFLLVLFVTLLAIAGTRGIQIDCDFKVETHADEDVYTCKAVNLMVTKEDDFVESVNGEHLAEMTNIDVKVLHIDDQNFNFFPLDLENFFPNLIGLKIVSSGLKVLTSENLKWFSDMSFADFTDNELESLAGDLFTYNSHIKYITFDSNKIKRIESEVFDNLDDLISVSLKNNECIDGSWSSPVELISLKAQLLIKCSGKVVSNTLSGIWSSIGSTFGFGGETPEDIEGMHNEMSEDSEGSSKITKITKVTKFGYRTSNADLSGHDFEEEMTDVTCDLTQTFWRYSAGDLYTCTIPSQHINHQDVEIKISESNGGEVKALSFNENKNIKFLPNNIAAAFPNLVELSAKNTFLESISGNVFEGLGHLKRISLSDNDLNVIKAGTFKGLDELEELDLSDGDIQFIEEGAFDGLKSLKTLHLGGNKLRFLQPKTFEGLTELRNISIELNHITDLDENLFSSNTKLVNIWLNGNKITSLAPKTFEGLSDLGYVDLQDNECIDEDYDKATFEDMKPDLEKNCSSAVVVRRTFKKYIVNNGGEDAKKIRSEYNVDNDEESEETVTRIVTYRKVKKVKKVKNMEDFEIEASLVEDPSSKEGTKDVEKEEKPKADEANPQEVEIKAEESKATESSPKNKPEDKTVICDVEDFYWINSGSTLPTCVIEDQVIDGKGFTFEAPARAGEVKALILDDNPQIKFLPENISGTFKNLAVFSAENSSLVLLSRKNFEGLENLKTLNLANNSIKFIDPDTFDDLKNLEELDLSNNQMEYIDENVFLKLKALKTLRLTGNKLHYVHAKLFKNLKNLQNISISSNQLSTLDDNIFKSNQKLQNVWLQNNKIKTLGSKIFSTAGNLDYVDLRDNKCIDGVFLKSELEDMKTTIQEKCAAYVLKHGKKTKKTLKPKKIKKERVKVEKTPEDEELKEVICENENVFWPELNETLLTCVISSDQVISEPGYSITINGPFALPLIKGESIQALSFANNRNIQFLPDNIHETFPNLLAISAAGSSLQSISKENFKNFSGLKSLNFSGNNLKTIPKDTFEDLVSLEFLDLEDNEFEMFEETTFVTTRKIRKLKLSGSKLVTYDPQLFETLTQLVEVSIDFEDPSRVTEEFFKSNPLLEVAKINGKLVDKSLNPFELGGDNEHTVTTASTTTGTSTAKSELQIVEEIECTFKETPSASTPGQHFFTCEIESEKLTEDSIFTIKDHPELERVKRFSIDNNKKVTSLPENLSELFPELLEISAVNSSLTGVDKKNLHGLSELRYLNLSGNKIKHLDSESFDDLEEVELIDLSDNDMEFLEETLLHKLKSLKYLMLEANKIHYIHPKTFKNLDSLETVSLSDNLLSVVEPFTFKPTRKLQKLELGGNKIESLSPKIVDSLKELKVINLEGNNCIDGSFGPAEFEQLKALVKENCKPKPKSKDEDEPEEVSCEYNAEERTCTVEGQNVESSNYVVKQPEFVTDEPVETLIFKGEDIKFLPKDLSATFPDISEISTVDTSLESVTKENFANLPKLKTLKLSGVQSIDPDSFEDLSSLETLDLEADAEEIDDDTFSKLVSLKKFIFTDRTLKTYPSKWFESFEELEEVELSVHPTFDFFYEIIQENPKLKWLNLNGNVVVDKTNEEIVKEVTEEPTANVIESETEANSADVKKELEESDPETRTTKSPEIQPEEAETNKKASEEESSSTLPSHRHEDSTPESVQTSRPTRKPRTRQPKDRRPTTTTPRPAKEVSCSLGYSNFGDQTLITCDLKDQEISDSETVIKPNPYSSHIEGLRIEDNKKVKYLPENIGKAFSKLTQLSAKNSSIESIFKDDFENLQNIKVIDLSGNNIQSIEPETFAGLNTLESLDLSDNEIDYIDETSFPNLESLKTLDLKNNKISFLHPKVFENLPELEEVFLEGNHLPKDFAEEEIFKNNPKLKKFIMPEQNQEKTTERPRARITSHRPRPSEETRQEIPQQESNDVPCTFGNIYWYFIDTNLFTCNLEETIDMPELEIQSSPRNARVKGLNFIDNKKIRLLPSNLSQKFPNLVAISGFNSNLESIPKDAFNGLNKVKYLNFAKNNLRVIEPGTFKDLSSLEELDLSDNDIESLDESTFENLPFLTTLYLGGNRLTGLPISLFEQLPNLRNLSLENNQIVQIHPSMLKRNRHLVNLWLNGNKLQNLSPSTFDDLNNLDYVDLQGNECIDKYFEGAGIVQMRVEINRNCRPNRKITKTPRPGVKPILPIAIKKSEVLCNFEYLDWPDTELNQFSCAISDQSIDSPDYTITPSPYSIYVKGLKIEGKNVKYLPRNIAETFPNLNHVTITNTPLETFDPETFSGLKDFKTLDLSNNKIETIEPEAFSDLSVVVLNLNHNRIPRIDVKTFPGKIRTLNLGNNLITFIIPEAFENLEELNSINLEGNNLAAIPENLFSGNKKLEKIKLSGNRINSLSAKTFENLPNIQSIDLEENSCVSGLYEPSSMNSLKIEVSRHCSNPTNSYHQDDFPPTFNQLQPDEDDGPVQVDPNEEVKYETSRKVYCSLDDTYSAVSNAYEQTCEIRGQPIDTYDFTFDESPKNQRVKRMVFHDDIEFLPQNIGESFPNLVEIEATNSTLKKLRPENFKSLPNLKTLDLSGNNLKFIEPETFDELTSLENLDLGRNQISFIYNLELPNLKELNLEENELSCVEGKSFSKLPNLRVLILSKNKLTNIDEHLFETNPLLEDVSLDQNLITSVNSKAFVPMMRLKRLSLKRNQCIDQQFNNQPFEEIQQVIQQNCQAYEEILGNFNICVRERSNCQRRLSLRTRNHNSGNSSSNANERVKKENEKLRVLLKKFEVKIGLLNGNNKRLRNALNSEKHLARRLKLRLKEAEVENENLRRYQGNCVVTDNRMIDLQCEFDEAADGFYTCKTTNLNIDTGNVTINNVKGIHKRGKRTADVTSLTVSDQNVKVLPDGIGDAFSHLKKLTIDNSNLRKIEPKGFKDLHDLTVLVIKGNHIASILPGSFDKNTKLEVVDLSGNHIHELPNHIFGKLSQLKSLTFDDNKIISFPYDFIPADNSLDQFSLSSNEIEAVDPRIFKRLKFVRLIDLRGNRCIDKEIKDAGNDEKLMFFGEIAVKCSNELMACGV